MKRIGFYLTMLLAGFALNQESFANPYELEGYWKCNTSGMEVEIYPTDFGFKSKHKGHNDWSYFDEIYQDHYRDRTGNEYHWRGNDGLFYHSSDGRNQMVFHKMRGNRNRGQYSPDDHVCSHGPNGCQTCNNWEIDNGRKRGNRYDDRGRNNSYSDEYQRGNRYSQNRLNGLWFSERGRSSMRIQIERRGINVNFDKGHRWIYFKEKRNGVFKDRKGNKIRILNRTTMQWTSDCGRYSKTFHKARRRGYRNR